MPKTLFLPIFRIGEHVVRSNAHPESFRFAGTVAIVIPPEEVPAYIKKIKYEVAQELAKLGCTFNFYLKELLKRDKDCFRNYWYIVEEDETGVRYICIESDLIEGHN